jgi:cytoskeletal protein RodZ
MASTVCALQLEQRRRKSGVSLESIAEKTKISSRFLRAIECEEFDKLPGGVFNTSYIRQYAACIAFPEDKLLEVYNSRMQEKEELDLLTLQRQVAQHRAAARPSGSRRSWFNWFRSPAAERT